MNNIKEIILILDFGSQYTHLIKNKLTELGATSIIAPGDLKLENWSKENINDYAIKGIILSGSPSSVRNRSIVFDIKWLREKYPTLGICYGHQLLAKISGGLIKKSNSEYGKSTIRIIKNGILLDDKLNMSTVWMSHGDSVLNLPKDFEILAYSDSNSIAAFQNIKAGLFGLQFHPEVSHTFYGMLVLKNFIFKACKITRNSPWSPRAFVLEAKKQIQVFTNNSNIIAGISGGVDSLTMLALLKISVSKKRLIAVYIDSGLMPNETEIEVRNFCKKYGINLLVLDKRQRFFHSLKRVTSPSEKCKVIGKTFIDVFTELAKKHKTDIFAQGTIWSDVIESGVTKFSSQIKPHHNVGGLPKKLNIRLLEPFRELFKNQVREIAKYFRLPDDIVNKKVFPGPGFAIRVQNVVTRHKVELVRNSTRIIENVLKGTDVSKKIWMAFSILIDSPSLGIKGDERQEYRNALVIRIVESKNSMTANFSRDAMKYLPEISRRIINETGIGRVVYDITDKPPATIEWQ
jgi:GMP synthase (glutamine-hydrolysing)